VTLRGAFADTDRQGDERNQLLQMITAHVRIRFALSAERFAERVTELARIGEAKPIDHAKRLSLDDLYLTTSCAENDDQAWTECAASYFDFIRNFARRFLPDATAGDLADQIIADLWQRQRIIRYEGRSTLKTWLGTVVANAAINERKATRRSLNVTTTEALDRERGQQSLTSPDSAPDADDGRVFASVVAQAIGSLDPEEKVLLHLYYEQELTLDEIEGVLLASKATLSRRLKRTRERLRSMIDELAAKSFGSSARALRERLTLERLDLDLSVLLRTEHVVKRDLRNGV
jgi:RNA polymerase sigma-70 factor (ECF subfamily)